MEKNKYRCEKMNKKKIYFIILTIITSLSIILMFDISTSPILVKIINLFGISSIYFLILYFFILKDRCPICGGKLGDTFPKDFPKGFRVCCLCLGVAKYIYSEHRNTEEERIKRIWFSTHYESYKDKFDNLFKIKKEKLGLIKNKW